MVKNLSCVSYGSLKRFPHTFTIVMGVVTVYFSVKKGKTALYTLYNIRHASIAPFCTILWVSAAAALL